MLRDEKLHKEETDVVMATLIPTRHKGETKEEKQARKQLVKQHNKVCVCVRVCLCIECAYARVHVTIIFNNW